MACAVLFTFAQQAAQAPKAPRPPATETYRYSCLITREDWTLKEGEAPARDVENWEANCKVTLDDKVIYEHKLPLGHPARFDEASAAAHTFITERGPEIAKQDKARRKESK